jgi:hypothetical protein
LSTIIIFIPLVIFFTLLVIHICVPHIKLCGNQPPTCVRVRVWLRCTPCNGFCVVIQNYLSMLAELHRADAFLMCGPFLALSATKCRKNVPFSFVRPSTHSSAWTAEWIYVKFDTSRGITVSKGICHPRVTSGFIVRREYSVPSFRQVENSRLLWNTKLHCSVHSNSPLASVPC